MRLLHLRLLLWKNFTLKKRRPVSFFVEIFVPLLLFILLAWARTRREPYYVNDEYFDSLALPSVGAISFLQSIYCGGTPTQMSTTSSTIDQALIILNTNNVTLSNVVGVLDTIAITEQDLNNTLAFFGLPVGPIFQAAGIPTITSLLPFLNAVANASGSGGSSGSSGNNNRGIPFYDVGAMDQTMLRNTINGVCSFAQSPPGLSLRSFLTGNLTSTFSQFLNASNPFDFLINVYRQQPSLITDLVPLLLDSLQTSNPTRFNFTNATVTQIREILSDSNASTAEIRQQLLDYLQSPDGAALDVVAASGIVAGLVGLNTTTQTLAALNALLALLPGPTTTPFVPFVFPTFSTTPMGANTSTTMSASATTSPPSSTPTSSSAASSTGARRRRDLFVSSTTATTSTTMPWTTATTTTTAFSPVVRLQELLGQLEDAFQQLVVYARVYEQIANLTGVKQAQAILASNSSLTSAIQTLICPTDGFGIDLTVVPSSFLNRRDLPRSDASGAEAHAKGRAGGAGHTKKKLPKPEDLWRDMFEQALGPLMDTHEAVEDGDEEQQHHDHAGEESAGEGHGGRARRASFVGGGNPMGVLQRYFANSNIYYAPNTSADVREVVRLANRTIDEMATLLTAGSCALTLTTNSTYDLGSINLDLFRGYPDEYSLVRDAMPKDQLYKVIAGIVFYDLQGSQQSLTSKARYAIRMNQLKVPSTVAIQDRSRVTAGGTANLLYYLFGFVPLQDMFNRALVDFYAGEHVPVPGAFVREFPVPFHRVDQFAAGISRSLPLLAVLAFIYSVSNIVKSVVYEKETRLKEAMKMMGLANWAHWTAWTITALIQLTITVLLMTIILVSGNIITQTQPVLLFLFLELFIISTISMSFAISVFFSKARLAAACAGIIYFLMYLPYVFLAIRTDMMTGTHKFLACLSSPTAFGLGCSYIANNELNLIPLTFSNMRDGLDPCDNFSFGATLGMLLLDSIIYFIITWYIEAVFPGEYGMPRRWYFFLQRDYWLGSRRQKSNYEAITPGSAPSKYCEPAPDLPVGLSIRNLVKVYDDDAMCNPCMGKKARRAVDNLSFDAYEGQITGLLGHNGAGKTTTMSMLVGLFPPTSGSAYINGLDIWTEMDEIRSHLGICPQYNVLFDELTVAEHLWFCARLKGFSPKDTKAEVQRFVEDVQLQGKADSMASTLSGGQKRKLSVALSFVGGSSLVILDEPTAGVDPSARRAIWDLLLHYREGRTILLSTHHMDEADLLSDRIAILAAGKLCCVGSTLFLKRAFGVGYTVTVCLGGERRPSAVEDLTGVMLRHVPEARLTDVAGQDVSFMLPAERTAVFEPLFRELETARARLGMTSYGVTATTLEEVFLRVAAEAEARAQRERELERAGERSHERDDLSDASDASLLDLSRSHSVSAKSEGAELEMKPVHSFHPNPALDNADMSNISIASDAGYVEVEGDAADDGVSRSGVPAAATNPTGQGAQAPPNPPSPATAATAAAGSSSDAAALLAPATPLPAPALAPATLTAGPAMPSAAEMVKNSYQDAALDIPVSSRLLWGPALWLQRFRAMLARRLHYSLRDRKAVISQIFLPAMFVLVGMLVATSFPPAGDPKALNLDPRLLSQQCGGYWADTNVPYASTATSPAAADFVNSMKAASVPGVNYVDVLRDPSYYTTRAEVPAMDAYLVRTYSRLERTRRGAVTVANERDPLVLFSAGEPPNAFRCTGHYDNRHRHAMPVLTGIMDQAVLQASVSANHSVLAINFPLNQTLDTKITNYLKSGTDLTVAINVIIALSFVPASFVVFLVAERVSKAKHLQFVSGVTPSIYWLSTFIWDMINYLLPAGVCMIVFLAFQLPSYSGRNFGAVVSLLMLYGFSITPMMYPFSFLFNVSSTAYIALISLNLFVGLTGTLATFTLELFPDDPELTAVNNMLKWIFLVFPNYCLGRGMMDLARNEYTAEFRELVSEGTFFKSPFGFYIIGRNLLFMFITGAVFMVLVVVIEYWSVHVARPRKDHAAVLEEGDDDVEKERERAVNLLPSTTHGDVLVVKDLSKTYKSRGKVKHAVKRLSFGIHPGECFGLLGVNGAGKTTTFKMLTGDTDVSSGEAWLCGHSILSGQTAARQKQGYCPQFDALNDLLTGRETLTLFARLRGIPEGEIPRIVNWTLQHMQLDNWADRVTRSYSGGNKRKLSVSITLLGNPPIIFLDEPTTGMDPKARRFLWNQIAAIVRGGRSVVLTSHSMEECEALCTRLGIMVDGRFRCMGSPQHLKSKYGNGYTLIAKAMDASKADAASAALLSALPGATLKEAHNGYLRLQLASEALPPLSELFALMEQQRRAGLVEDYSLSQTTLDEIFCNFAQQAEHLHEKADGVASSQPATITAV